MASESSEKKKARRNLKKRARVNSDQHLERLNSLPWSSSLPESNGAGDDGFSLFIGSDELEGGFLTLEEIDESEYGLDIPNDNVKNERQKLKGKTKSKKRKIYEGDADESSGGELSNESDNKAKESIEEDEKKEVKRKKKKKNVKRKKKDHQQNNETIKAEETAEPAAECFLLHENLTSASDGRDNGDAEDAIQAYSNTESLYSCRCSSGKDVIGAAETGSGKTLAFGLPILQRLLEEREKEERLMAEKGEANERIAPQGVLRALIVTPTRELALQVTDHLKAVALGTNVRVVPIVGGMSTEKQERLLKARPEIVVGTPGDYGNLCQVEKFTLWSKIDSYFVTAASLLVIFVLDEADRMIETGHFRELQSIIDMLPMNRESAESQPQDTQSCVTVASVQRKKRQTLVFSATLSLSHDFRKKLKHGSVNAKKGGLNSIETLSERAGMRANTAVVDLTNASIMANKLVESIIEYVFSLASLYLDNLVHNMCHNICLLQNECPLLAYALLSYFPTLITPAYTARDFTPHFIIIAYPQHKCMDPSFRDAAAGTPKGLFAQLLASLIGFTSSSQVYFHVPIGSSEQIPVNYVAQSSKVSGTRIDLNVRGSEQSSVDRFRANEHGILVATDAAARGLDIPGVRTVVHYQLPLSAEIYVHRCGRTARASTDGCSIALISPNDASKFAALCKSFAKESFQRFPVEISYMPEIMKRSSLAHQIDKIVRKDSQEKAEKTWLERNAESVELVLDDDDSEEDRVKKYRQNKSKSNQLKKLQQELNTLLSRPLQPKAFSKRFLAGAGVSPLLQHQLEELSKQKLGNVNNLVSNKRRKLVVIGQDCVEPLQALRSASNEACLDLKEIAEKHKNSDNLRRKRKEMKKRLHEQRRKQRKKLQQREG
ncbi:hypothetical protein DH2020_048887 [Rehmannia glutinosa]|uniref:DEAD-box ATP-dependent RNA helicase n=1 Tax=Rehmannia glutinosa TaxID=99300 RepID=A0ABR0U4E8_REHGL